MKGPPSAAPLAMCEQYGIDTIARKVIQLDPATGCSGLSLSSLNEVGELTCDEAGRSHVSLLEELYDGDTHLRCFAVAETIADVCGTYTEVPHAETRSLTDLLAMACGRDNNGVLRLRVVYILDTQAPCEGCDVDGVAQRVARSFRAKDGLVYLIVAPPQTSDAVGLSCDDANVETQSLVAGALAAVGSCGTYAWRAVLT